VHTRVQRSLDFYLDFSALRGQPAGKRLLF
jgi:hypothetical protein